jgi:hypothetical protein
MLWQQQQFAHELWAEQTWSKILEEIRMFLFEKEPEICFRSWKDYFRYS